MISTTLKPPLSKAAFLEKLLQKSVTLPLQNTCKIEKKMPNPIIFF